MKLDAILFDLDGTLLPMDNDAFIKGYLHMLSEAVKPYGYAEQDMVAAMWRGVAAMVKNDCTHRNSELFWQVFAGILGEKVYADIPHFDAFYKTGFHKAISLTSPTPLAKQAVALAREKAAHVVLATNPFFPRVAVEARLSWAGLAPTDFDLITDYDNSGSCKPNPLYYDEIAKKLSLDPKRCLMIGNNAQEDVEAAQAIGMSTFLLTDCLIAKGDLPQTPKGSFPELICFLQALS